MKKLIVMVDLARVRAVETTVEPNVPEGRVHLVEVPGAFFEEAKKSIHEVVTDQAGRSGGSSPAGQAGGMGYGEEHELENEMERKAIGMIASQVDRVVAEAGHPFTILAAPKSVLKRLEAKLSEKTRQSIRKSVPADLTKAPLSDLEKRFLA